MTLHDRIKRLEHGYCGANFSLKDGFQLARHEAAHMAKEADELMAEMAEALSKRLPRMDSSCSDVVLVERVCNSILKYNAYKEQ